MAWGAEPTALTVDQVVDRYMAARGGEVAWQKIQTLGWAGHIESGAPGTPRVPFLMYFKRPNATHFEVQTQGQKSLRIFNGARGWKEHPNGEGVPVLENYGADEVSFARDAGGLDGPLFGYRAKGVKVDLEGRDVSRDTRRIGSA